MNAYKNIVGVSYCLSLTLLRKLLKLWGFIALQFLTAKINCNFRIANQKSSLSTIFYHSEQEFAKTSARPLSRL